MRKATLFMMFLAVSGALGACGEPAPVATGYKKSIEASAQTDVPVVAPGTGTGANLTNGKAVYDKACKGCHQPLETTAKPNKTLATLAAAAPPKNPSHSVNPGAANWPTGQDAIDLEAALKK